MAWNTSVLLAERKSISDMEGVIPDVFLATGRSVGWEEASSASLGNDLAISELPGWGVLWTPNARVTTFPDVLEAASSGGRALTLVLGGADDYYAFYLYQQGKEVRSLSRRLGKLSEQTGPPLPEEASLDWRDDEDTLFELARLLTGVELANFDLWSAVRFVVATLDY